MSEPTFKLPLGLRWRSSTSFILSTIAIGMFTDLFFYGLLVPILPFLLPERLNTPPSKVQTQTSVLLAAYAAAQVLLSLPVGWIADKLPTRRAPFLIGLTSLLLSTILLYLGQTFFVLVLARILQGMSAAIVWVIGLAMVLETVGSDKLGVTIGTIFGFISVGELVAPVLGGILYDKAGYGAVFALGFALLIIDLATRILVIERKVAESKYGVDFSSRTQSSASSTFGADEESPLIANDQSTATYTKPLPLLQYQEFKILSNPSPLFVNNPILYPLTHSRTLAALLLNLIQPLILAIFDATLPLHVKSLFGFSSLQSGLLFIPLLGPHLFLGPISGRFVDKHGVKPAAVIGLFSLIPTLILLRLPQQSLVPSSDQTFQISLLCVLLLCASCSLSLLGSPGLVEASFITEQYHTQNPELFGKQGPYGKLYAVTSMVYSFGLTIGPLAAGVLRERIGYGNMSAVIAGVCAVVGVVSWRFLGGKPGLLVKREERLRRQAMLDGM